MSKNSLLVQALENTPVLTTQNSDLRNKALDALLTANRDKPEEFRSAIANHNAFWTNFTGLMDEPLPPVVDYFKKDDFLDSKDNTESFKKMQLIAAEQRVKLGLKAVDKEVLVKILANNSDECRKYLNSKSATAQLGDLTKVPGWVSPPQAPGAATPAPVNGSSILNDEAVARIRSVAKDQLLLQLIAGCEDADPLKALHAAADKSQLETAANHAKFGYPAAGNQSLTFPLSGDIKKVLAARIQTVVQQSTRKGFEDYVLSLSTEDLLDKKDDLEDATHFLNTLPEPHRSNLSASSEDKEWALSLLGQRYLWAYLPTVAKPLDLLNTQDLPSFKKALEALTGKHDYVNLAVNDATLSSMRRALFTGHVNQLDYKDLKALVDLDKANLVAFQAGLKSLGVDPSDWVVDDDLGFMKVRIRSRAFEIQVNEGSRLFLGGHPSLISAFNKLPVMKQKEILQKPEILSRLLNATEANVVQHYFGKDAAGIDELVAENKYLAETFRVIQNAVVAYVLANYEPQLNLTVRQVEQLNEALVTKGTPSVHKAVDFDNLDEYKALIDAIKDSVQPDDLPSFYQAFGLQKDGNAFASDASLRNTFKVEYANNAHLLNAYHDPKSTVDKRLVNLLLCMDKGFELDAATVNQLSADLSAAKTRRELIDNLCKHVSDANVKKQCRARLLSELTPALFIDLKSHDNKQALASANPTIATPILDQLKAELSALQEDRQVIGENADHLDFLQNINPIHLYNPVFQGQAKEKAQAMQAKFTELAADCDALVEKLRHDLLKIQGLQNSLPPKGNDKAIEKLREQFIAEAQIITDNLKKYLAAQQKLSGKKGILEAVADAAKGNKNYLYQGEGVSCSVRTGKKETLLFAAATNKNTTVSVNPGQALDFLVGDKLNNNQERVFRVSHKGSQDGCFSERHSSRDMAAPMTGKSGGPKPTGRFEIEQFPKAPLPPAPKDEQALTEAKVNFSMAMAAQILASMDEPPSKKKPIRLNGVKGKEEELQYLWTALVILGENNPHMAFDSDAIDVVSATFNPDTDVKGKYFGKWGMKDESIYQSVFKNDAFSKVVDIKVKQFGELTEAKFAKTDQVEKVDKKLTAVTKLFKDDVTTQRAKEEVKTKQDADGPVPHTKP